MDHPTAQHQEIIGTDQNMMVCPNNNSKADQRKPRPQPEQALKCPRCDSTNTKFCYYNNYSLSQPRYFCKSCRRYWTQGGTLRNVPVGGGCRKNKRSSSSSSSSSSSKKPQDHHTFPGPLSSYDHDLSLAFARLHKNTNSCGPATTYNDFDFSILGMPNTADVLNGGGGFGYSNNISQAAAMYYGNDGDNNNMEGIEHGSLMPYDHQYNNSSNNSNSNATTTAVTVTTMKQELFGCGERENNESSSRILWGYPNWQMNNYNNAVSESNMGDFDSTARESWNSFNASSSWHGLLNSPLM